MPRPVLSAVALVLMIPATSAAEPPGEADSDVADPADPGESEAHEAAENRVAYAGPPGAYVPETEPPPAPAPDVPSGLIQARDSDAASGRAYLTPTAITGRKGSVRVDTWFPGVPIAGFAGVTYSATSKLELGVGAFWIADEGEETVLALRAKWAPLQRPRGGVALMFQHIAVPDDDESITTLTATGSYCLDAACRTIASVHLTAVPDGDTYIPEDGSSGPALHLVGGASLVTGGRVKLVLDALTFGEDDDRIVAGYAGVRLARRSWALDAGLVGAGEGDDFEAAPLPLVGASARW